VRLTGFGEKDAVMPEGRPLIDKVTLPAKPLFPYTYTYVVADVPIPSVTDEAESCMLGATMERVMVVVLLIDPDVPVIVTV
jgi:hypothetical protein